MGAASLSVRPTGKDQGMRLSSGGGAASGAAAMPVAPSRAPQPEAVPVPDAMQVEEEGAAELRMQSSGEVAPGGEAGVIVSLSAAGGVRSAVVELAYDPNVLTPQGNVSAPGRVALTLTGSGQEARAELRFRALPNAPAGATGVQVGNVVAVASDGNPLQVHAPSPVDIVVKGP